MTYFEVYEGQIPAGIFFFVNNQRVAVGIYNDERKKLSKVRTRLVVNLRRSSCSISESVFDNNPVTLLLI